jgi:hypothetical protein
MSELSIRTCTRCGKKKPSNRIYSKSVPKKISGSSSRSINIFTLIGGFLGDKGSATALKQWLFQSSNRKYGAELTKDINLCSLCYHRMPSQSGGYGIFKIIFFPFYIPYKILKILLTSPLIKELVIFVIGIFIWLIMKILTLLGKLGFKFADQDGDGKLDKKDFELAINKVTNFFTRSKQEEPKN